MALLAKGEKRCRRWHANTYYANHLADSEATPCCERCPAKEPPICRISAILKRSSLGFPFATTLHQHDQESLAVWR
ncbi:hypothetical protein BC629DRAFT_1740678 [Irpex lacteus]|nr:hypothetical protein BC629DRAFT_1740678 [Irpex lacteus]